MATPPACEPAAEACERQREREKLDALRKRLEDKTAERERMLGLFRRGRIDDATLDGHLDLIDAEAAGLQAEVELADRALSPEDQAAHLHAPSLHRVGQQS